MINDEQPQKADDQLFAPRQESLADTPSVTQSDPLTTKLLAILGLADTVIPDHAPVEALASFLGQGTLEERTTAVRRLGESGQREAVIPLIAALKQSEDARVRAAAGYALGELAVYVPVEPLLDALMDDDAYVRAAVIWALGQLGERLPDEAILPLFAAFSDEDEDTYVRVAALRVLTHLGERIPVKYLVNALKDPAWQIRQIAVTILGEREDDAHIEELEALLDDDVDLVCKAAVYALGKIWVGVSGHLPNVSPSITVKDNSGQEGLPDGRQSDSALSHGEPPDETDDLQSRRRIQGDIQFYAYESGELEGTKVVAQALDNQWVPRSLLRAMVKGKISIKDAEKYLEGLVRTEYIRSLINGERVIMNRAYLYNNPALARDYLSAGTSREAFKKLLDKKVIVPWLLYELSPDQKPDFGTSPSFQEWQKICRQVAMHCVRFSWNEKTYNERQLTFTRDFHDFVENLYRKDSEKLALDLGLDVSSEEALFQRLNEMHRSGGDYFLKHRKEERPHITRNVLYQEFVSASKNTAERVYDGTKPFSGEIKQLLDLFYNAHQADAFQGYLLTPIDSPTRQILQEWNPRSYQKDRQVGSASLIEMLRGSAFALVEEGLYLRSMGLLTLQDVLGIRDTEVWQKYIKSLQALLENPIGFSTLAQSVYYSYIDLAKEMTHRIELRQLRQGGVLVAPWEPSQKVQIEAGGTSVEVVWNKDGIFYLPKNEELLLKSDAPDGSTPITVRWTIGDSGAGSVSTQAKLFSSFEIMQGRMYNAQKEWQELIKGLRTALQSKEMSVPQEQKIEAPTMNERL